MSLKSKTLKLAPLLAQFLYSQKRLDLEGIGSFYIDSRAAIDNDPNHQQSNQNISFESNPSIRESPDLIGYISSQTGKMKALASADLRSHLELVQQFLNIGKPFLLEGIGILVKIRSGIYEFSAGSLLTEKLKEQKDPDGQIIPNDRPYEPFLKKETLKNYWSKPVLAILILAGIGLAVLGGYTLYKRNATAKLPGTSNTQQIVETQTPTSSATESLSTPVTDTVSNASPVSNPANQNYKFVLETAPRKRAFARFEKLKQYQWDVKIETRDSMQYKLYLILPSLALDTSRVMDSLTALNGKKVYIENQ